MTDAGLMERTLEALAGREDQLRIALFERFFAEFPARRADFLAFDASSRRMADETLQLLYGMATGADWLWTQTADLVDLHRAYGALPQIEFDRFVDLTGDTACDVAGATVPERAAWGAQAAALKRLIARARAEWEVALPR